MWKAIFSGGVVLVICSAPGQSQHVGGDRVPVVHDLHDVAAGAGMDLLADQPPRHRIECLANLDMAIGRDLADRPRRELEWVRRQRDQRRGLHRLEHPQRLGAVEGAAVADTGDLETPPDGLGLHLGQGREFPSPPE
jgi:hypothetical protein